MDNKFFNTIYSRAQAKNRAHKWYAPPDATPSVAKTSNEATSTRGVGGGYSVSPQSVIESQQMLVGTPAQTSPTSYGPTRKTTVDYYTGREYSGGPYGYRDAPVDFATGEPIGSPLSDVGFVQDDGDYRVATLDDYDAMSSYTGMGDAPRDFVTSGEVAVNTPIGAIGTANPVALDILDMLDGTAPFGIASIMGPTVMGARGEPTALGSGMPSVFSRQKVQKDYEVFEAIKDGKPGYHQFYAGNQLVSIAPTPSNKLRDMVVDIGVPLPEYTAYGNVSIDQAKQMIGGAKGIDPNTIDFSKGMDDEGFGERLVGWVPDVGGIAQADGAFIDSAGVRHSKAPAVKTYAGLMAARYGTTTAAANLNALALKTGNENYSQLARDVAEGKVTARSYRDDSGNNLGFETPTGGYVTDNDGNVVKTGSGGYAVWGTGPASPEAVLGDRVGDMSGDSGVGIGDFSVSLGGGYGSMSGSDGLNYSPEAQEATSRGDTFFDAPSYDPGFDEGDTGDTGGMDQATADSQGGSSFSSPFARGGRVERQEGTPDAGEAVAPSGFIEKPPTEVTPEETVKDDVPMDVEEQAFIMPGASIEIMGIQDYENMIAKAVEFAKKKGIDIPENGGKMGKGEVPLNVSKGEGYISATLAKIIGYDKLQKIRKRGLAEVERRAAEAEQTAQNEPAPTDAMGRQMAAAGTPGTGAQMSDREWEGWVRRSQGMFGDFSRYKEPEEPLPPRLLELISGITRGKDELSTTDVGMGGTERQRRVSEGLSFNQLTPEKAQELYINFPTVRNIILKDVSGKQLEQAQEALRNAETILKSQIGDNVPQQNAAVSVDEAFGDVMDIEGVLADILDGGKKTPRVVSETKVIDPDEENPRRSRRGNTGFVSKSY